MLNNFVNFIQNFGRQNPFLVEIPCPLTRVMDGALHTLLSIFSTEFIFVAILVHGLLAVGLFAVGQFAVKKNVSFG